jgi:hypothetical protein
MVAISWLLTIYVNFLTIVEKVFNLVLLQGVVDAKCKFWDYDFGRAILLPWLDIVSKDQHCQEENNEGHIFLPLKW